VLTELTTNVSGLLEILLLLTSFKAETALDGADTAIWLAASPDVDACMRRPPSPLKGTLREHQRGQTRPPLGTLELLDHVPVGGERPSC
jgi:hypothetical protein